METIFIKRYGICEVLQKSYPFYLIKLPNNSKICWNIIGII